MAFTVQSVMQKTMTNPEVLVVGMAAGFVIKWFMDKRNRGMGGGFGGGF